MNNLFISKVYDNQPWPYTVGVYVSLFYMYSHGKDVHVCLLSTAWVSSSGHTTSNSQSTKETEKR